MNIVGSGQIEMFILNANSANEGNREKSKNIPIFLGTFSALKYGSPRDVSIQLPVRADAPPGSPPIIPFTRPPSAPASNPLHYYCPTQTNSFPPPASHFSTVINSLGDYDKSQTEMVVWVA